MSGSTYDKARIPAIPDPGARDFGQRVREYIYVREGRTGPDPENDRFATKAELDALTGLSGWFDDGVNFRITVTNGRITAVSASQAAGYSLS